MFTQSVILFASRELTLDDIEGALSPFEVHGRTAGDETAHWAFGAPALILQLPGTVDGRVIVDVVNERWHDLPGDPDQEPDLFAAWSMGGFGPLAYPGCLERAGTQAWAWRQASSAIRQQKCFVRLRTTYLDDDDGQQTAPEDHDPKGELLFLSEVGRALLGVTGMICWFDPAGEAVRPPHMVEQALDWHLTDDALPLDLWTNVRLGKLDDDGSWLVMDSIGMQQLGLPDIEIAFARDAFTFDQVSEMVRDLVAYLAEEGDVVEDGHTVDGPDDSAWLALRFDGSRALPPRPVVRLVPVGVDVPEALLARAKGSNHQ